MNKPVGDEAAPWGVVSVKPQNVGTEIPMQPITMMPITISSEKEEAAKKEHSLTHLGVPGLRDEFRARPRDRHSSPVRARRRKARPTNRAAAALYLTTPSSTRRAR